MTELFNAFRTGRDATERPAVVKDAHLAFLDDLRERGEVNMLGAGLHLFGAFAELSRTDAETVLGYWVSQRG